MLTSLNTNYRGGGSIDASVFLEIPTILPKNSIYQVYTYIGSKSLVFNL
jgi:hypothetical protein